MRPWVKILLAALLLLCRSSPAQGYIVPNGVVYGGYETAGIVNGYKISVLDNPSGALSIFSPYTQFWMSPTGENTFSFSELTDVGVRIF
jgi:hypothetical protein